MCKKYIKTVNFVLLKRTSQTTEISLESFLTAIPQGNSQQKEEKSY